MADVQIKLSLIWVALMLSYLLGDVLRIFSGDAASGKMGHMAQFSQAMWLGIAILMVIPILMVVLTLILPTPISRWANIIVAVGLFLFNVIGLPTYPRCIRQIPQRGRPGYQHPDTVGRLEVGLREGRPAILEGMP